MKLKAILFPTTLITMLALFSCAKEAKQEAVKVDATPEALVIFDVQGMTCTGCETNVKLALKNVEGVKKVEPSYEDAEARITVDPDKVNEEAIVEALGKIGYTAKKKAKS